MGIESSERHRVRDIDPVYQPLYTSRKRYFLLTGGRSSLKSTSVSEFILRLTEETNHGILFTRYTLTAAYKSIIPEFQETIRKNNAESLFKVKSDRITNLRTNSYIMFAGIKASGKDQTARLKSIPGITTWIIDEMEDFTDNKAFDTIDDSIRTRVRQNRIIMIMNPTVKEHFVYERFIKNNNKKIKVTGGWTVTVSNHPDVCHIHSTYHLAIPYLNDSFLKKAKDSLNKAKTLDDPYQSHYYFNYIGGWLEKAEGVVFENWEEGVFDESLFCGYGLDFGYSNDPTALVEVAVDDRNKKIYLREQIYMTGLNTDQIADLLKDRLRYTNDMVVADSDEARLNDELRANGFNIIDSEKGAGSVRAGIMKMKEYQLIIDPESHNLKIELNNYAWHDKRSKTPIDAYNHLIDATRYALEQLLSRGIHIV